MNQNPPECDLCHRPKYESVYMKLCEPCGDMVNRLLTVTYQIRESDAWKSDYLDKAATAGG